MKIQTYFDAQQYLESLIPNAQNKRLTNMRLERIEHLLRLIDNPHHVLKSIHVGGTSGKGSTAYLISHILTTAGYKTGLHISPHLQTINERMQINNQPIPDQELIKLVNWIKPYIQQVEENNQFGTPSYFEVLVAMSFEYFKRKKVDLTVVEVGLGGTLDATNIIHPLVSIITNVDLDHIEILGDTVEKIALDKSGIIKENTIVITYAKQKKVIKIIQKKCREKNAHLTIVGRDVLYTIKKITAENSLFDLKTPRYLYKNVSLALLGRHQVENAAVAISAVETIAQSGFIIKEKHIRNALSRAFFPGRMEIVRRNQTIILDGAHNPAKIKALVETLKELFHQKILIIVGFKKNKDINLMIATLLPIANQFIITTFSTMTDTGKSLSKDPLEIAAFIKTYHTAIPYTILPTASAAIEYALRQSTPNDIILFTGSLYLVGEIRSILKNNITLFSQSPKVF